MFNAKFINLNANRYRRSQSPTQQPPDSRPLPRPLPQSARAYMPTLRPAAVSTGNLSGTPLEIDLWWG